MSIVACVKVHDGFALGADSATTISGKDQQGKVAVLKVYHEAKKIFEFNKLPVGILTYGTGNIGKKSIQILLRDFEAKKSISEKSYTIKEITEKIYSYFKKIYDEQFNGSTTKPILGFYIAGYSYGCNQGEEWEFVIPDGKCKMVRPLGENGSSWRGITMPFSRLYYGIDPRIKEELRKCKIDQSFLDKFQAAVIYDGMPLKVAVKFVEFVLKTTIELAAFEIGPESCSEPIHSAVIDSKKGFEWLNETFIRERRASK